MSIGSDWENDFLRLSLRRYWRSKRQLLLLQLGEEECWLYAAAAGKLLWQERLELPSGAAAFREQDAYLQLLEEALRELLLRLEVEEGTAVLLLPAPAQVHYEGLRIPELGRAELQRTVAWEAERCAPWGGQPYSLASAVSKAEQQEQQEQMDTEAGEQTLHLWLLPQSLQLGLQQLCQRLLLRLVAVCVPAVIEQLNGAAEADAPLALTLLQHWYEGRALLCFRKVALRFDWEGSLRPLQRWLPRLAVGALLLCSLVYAGAWGSCWLARQQLQELGEEQQQYAVWQQRRTESRQRTRRLQQLKQAVSRKSQQASLSGELERLGQTVQPGCWLTVLEQQALEHRLLLQGEAESLEAVQGFIEQLQQTGRYAKLELQESRQLPGGVQYKLLVQTQEVKHGKQG